MHRKIIVVITAFLRHMWPNAQSARSPPNNAVEAVYVPRSPFDTLSPVFSSSFPGCSFPIPLLFACSPSGHSMYMSPRTPCIAIPISCIALEDMAMAMSGIDRLIAMALREAGLALALGIMKRISPELC